MTRLWRPTAAGKLLTKAPEWSFELDGESIRLAVQGQMLASGVSELESLAVKRGFFWATLFLALGTGKRFKLDGIPNEQARQLQRAVIAAQEAKREREQIEALLRDFDLQVRPILRWSLSTIEACKRQVARRGWLSQEFMQRMGGSKPTMPNALIDHAEVRQHLAHQPQGVQDAVRMWQRSLQEFAQGVNQRHAAKVAQDDQAFFERVEKSPLTLEQRNAVVCFDSRVLLVASAGSGKTGTMVAKAGYALRHGYFAPERMLLLAFNNDAAAELRERVHTRLIPLGLPADKVAARTFHAFGLEVIGAATGKKPSLAPWLEGGQDLETLASLVDDLKDRDRQFRTQWDLFRVVLGQDLPKFGKEQDNPNAWDAQQRRGGFWTLNGETVKSQGEVVLANWLFYNGVRYVYEGAYEHETADASHRQYRPDFYLPDAKAYLEHWALNEKGEPPKEFTGYKEGMAWKRALHQQHETILLETTMAELWSGKALEYLERELQVLGVTLDPNPDRPVPGRQPIENPRLASTFRSFLTHVKSNRLSMPDLRARLAQGAAGDFRFRHEVFLQLFDKLSQAWEQKLSSSGCIDFEDMLNLATDCIESGKWASPYELVMVDEFQDASQARARMVAALMRGEDKYMFAVGDDWQGINRFAGADLAVMTGFETRFGQATTLKLETTFRCPPTLCEISSTFVRKNPSQIAKQVRSPKVDIVEPVRIVRVEEERFIRAAVEGRIREIAREAAGAGRRATVYLLARYQKDRSFMPATYDSQWVEISFLTVHRSKGLEADHVIVPRVTAETLGFPSKIADDPVLQLAMPAGEAYEFAEERRLFYVALTRARSTATLITVQHMESSFISELVKEQGLRVLNADGSEGDSEICPKCGKGFLRTRTSRYGPFLSCSTFPKCDYKRDDRRNRHTNRGRS
ncbi:DNA helicase-4 [Variovorax sp. HW608]|uniref:UvrD-helicase domain-containing protein n=1 Tax=Variovorax sp. HW608 TaxID=1034889 RepID=UPI000820036E|nr:UvrD-helicase domain-containing protein [Variovorax sp. HW608]SCK54689.1 DNA helicase-4 [Variovorax sp. HW608]